MDLHYKKIELPFHYPFTISGGRSKTHQPSLVVALQLGNYIGYGEAPAIAYYNITVEQMIADIVLKKRMIEKFAFTEPERYWHYLHHLLPQNPFLVSALDMAAWDLFGKLKGKLLYQLWNTNFDTSPQTDYTIGIDTVEKMVEKIKANPYPIYKIKVGFDDDINVLTALRKHTQSVFRVDANAGWTLDEAITKIPTLQQLGVELIEQPLAKDDWNGMKVLFEKATIPLFADESCVKESDVEKCVNHFHGINIKLTKCSGITPAIRMIQRAKELNLKVMMGSMNETSLGAAANANFLPQLDYVDMDGPLLLKEDIATGLSFNNGRVAIAGKYGLGVMMNSEWLMASGE
jgi:L-alanine-DL-glutamate epimerase-like enolase superfamily enzyme